MFFLDADGTQRSLPSAWTDAAAPDPFVVVAAGRSAFRVADLLAVAVGRHGARPSTGRLPLPAKFSIEVLPPIDLCEELGGAGGDPNEGYELVTGRIQDTLRELDEARALPLIG